MDLPPLSPVTRQVIALPSQWYRYPQSFLTEYVCLGADGIIGHHGASFHEVGPRGKRKHQHRSHANSQFAPVVLGVPAIQWNMAEVTFRGNREVVLWTQYWDGANGRVTSLLEQRDTEFLSGGVLKLGEDASGPAYIVQGFVNKASVDIKTNIDHAPKFGSIVRPLFKQWWHAVHISGGWRIFGDCETELTYARLSLS